MLPVIVSSYEGLVRKEDAFLHSTDVKSRDVRSAAEGRVWPQLQYRKDEYPITTFLEGKAAFGRASA